ncbi:hypothetical protein I7F13_23265 [Sinorhizobium meliloti]|uniref:hypothetical protein n=1 Tax=Sinorhizobium TaxID=28105 RepID=UPI000FD5E201|nr:MULTISPECIES: hypothetical protein [Sinorhizobium]MDE3825097.1 hypothetical protein [Sinorhizobium meliloti]MDW9823480.1 hypothetical protein [Sinorhizobium meliloti]MDW9866347.1 hypothetical protein [Sinorhizobium meliloti]MDX0213862.1 hypothetical protein [Sinorhizobium meliloti]MDX0604913.1 hypothetical protein [Sinorhizobium medicae]
MPKRKMEKGDDVLIRGTVVWFDETGLIRVRIPGYQYPITVDPDQIVEVIKAAEPKRKLRRKPVQDEPT